MPSNPLQQDQVLTFVQRGHLMDRNTTIPLPIKGYIVQTLFDSMAIYSASVGVNQSPAFLNYCSSCQVNVNCNGDF